MKNKFQKLIKNFADLRTVARARNIKKTALRIKSIDKTKFSVQAEVQGGKVIPYKLNIDLNNGGFISSIKHDCFEYQNQKKKTYQFCRHLTMLFYNLFEDDNVFACKCLERLLKKQATALEKLKTTRDDIDHFISQKIEGCLNFEHHGFTFFFDHLKLDALTRETLNQILLEAKQYPASLGGQHGGYIGGLFDHILLVTNYAYYLHHTMHGQTNLKQLLLTAIYHDFGKISYYGYKKSIPDRYVRVSRLQARDVRQEIFSKFRYKGKDPHVEEAIAVVKKFHLPIDREMERGIIFHHGSWSRYYPNDMNKVASVVHIADMMASQVLFV